MKNIYSNIIKFNKNSLIKTIKSLKKNNIVGLPTETVYGLAGNAYSSNSVNKIYELKKRPKHNPLIIHYNNLKSAEKDVEVNEDLKKLYKKFCPGPLTFILKKKKLTKISKLASSQLSTVAIRFPSHQIIRYVLNRISFPLAIPSANISSGISPISAKDVAEEFNNKLKIIIDGGQSQIGIESTVLDLSGKINILRPGIISATEIEKIIKKKVRIKKQIKMIKSPGGLKKHYSPGIPIIMNSKFARKNHAFIIMGKKCKKTKNIFNLSVKSNLHQVAKNLYKTFRKIKKLKYKKIYIVKIPNKGIGVAINDRLKKASQK